MAPMSAEPALTVVVATHQRRRSLRRLVDGLEQQEDAPPFEVVVVDDGSTDGTAAELEHLIAEASFPLAVVRLDRNRGPAAARNVGWRRAAAPFIAFTDDDCAPGPGWIAALTSRLGEADAVQG